LLDKHRRQSEVDGTETMQPKEATMTNPILPTRNAAWGFHGTIDHLECTSAGDAARAWGIAFAAIARVTGATPEGVRDFLDARHGRHFADDVANGLAKGRTLDAAIDAAVARWMGWIIDRRMARETGIPHGLPYLMGLATHFQILAEADDGV
jgi:hypothetical protein